MKLAIPFALAGFILGCVAGVLFVKRSQAVEAAPAPSAAGHTDAATAGATDADERVKSAEKKAADTAAELAKAKEQIAKLEKKKGGKPEEVAQKVLTPEEAKAKAEELHAKIADLVAKKDGKALIKLMHELAALGEAGYMGAIEVSGILARDVEGGPNELGISQMEFYKSFGGPMLPVMVWGLQKGEEISAGFRVGVAWSLPWQKDVDAAKLFIDQLKVEKTADVARTMAAQLSDMARPEMASDIAEMVPKYASDPKTMAALMDSLAHINTPEALASLEAMTRSANDAVRSEAEMAMIAVRPPAAGLLITTTFPDSQAESVGIKRGDIITSYNGSTIANLDDLRSQIGKSTAESVVTVQVNRKGEIITVQLKGGTKMGIDGKTVAPK